MKTDFGAFPKEMMDRWSQQKARDEERAEKFMAGFREANERSLESQMERYEAAISGYVPEPKPEQEPVKIRFKRPIPFKFEVNE